MMQSSLEAHTDFERELGAPCSEQSTAHCSSLPEYAAVAQERSFEKAWTDGQAAAAAHLTWDAALDLPSARGPSTGTGVDTVRSSPSHSSRHHQPAAVKSYREMSWSCAKLLRASQERLPPVDTRLGRVVQSPYFGYASGVVIILNSALLAYSADYAMQNTGLPPPRMLLPFELFFCIIYAIEFILQLLVYGWRFLCCVDWQWNWFDLVLVVSSSIDVFSDLISQDTGFNMSFMRLVRLVKMLKMLRIVRLVKAFRQIRLITRSLLQSAGSFFWSLFMLLFILLVFGNLFVQASANFLEEAHSRQESMDVEESLREHWSSIHTAMLTLYLCSTGGLNWGEAAGPLRAVGRQYFISFVIYIAFFHFAVLNIITSLLVESTMNNADIDQRYIISSEIAKKSNYVDSIRMLYDRIGKDVSGGITLAHFQDTLESPEMMAFCSALELEASDVTEFFRLLAGDGASAAVDLDSFVVGCMKLRGTAKSMDLVGLSYEHQKTSEQLRCFREWSQQQMQEINLQLAQLPSRLGQQTNQTNGLQECSEVWSRQWL